MSLRLRLQSYKGLVILPLLFALGCTEKEKIVVRQAAPDVRESFAQKSCEKSICLTVQKESLNKVYLMVTSGKGGGATVQWYDFKPMLVSFDQVGDRIALFEENYRSVYEEIKNRELVQTFEIVSEDAESIQFKWGQGLQTLVYESPISSVGPAGMPKDEEEEGIQREYLTVIDSVTLFGKVQKKMMEIHQVSKIRNFDVKKGFSEETLGMNIQFYPYEPSANFTKRLVDSQRRVGFFATKTGVKGFSEKEIAFANHWDIQQPIKVLVSSAVPKEFEQAVKEGALYWNKVFGTEAIEVQLGVDPAVEPAARTIIVRWIPWLDSGAAYATHQTDPLTGEILRAQVFMPSVFTRVGSADLVELNGNHPVVKGQGFVSCDLTKKFATLNSLMKEADDSKRLKLARDSVRSTIAHELGHALGMRHNFAGSYSAKISTRKLQEAAATYLQDESHQGVEASTSIMDYQAGIDDILTSARLKFAALSYDKMAMDYAVKGTIPDPEVSLFCTDEDISIAKAQGLQIYGCERFDSGNNPLYRKYLDTLDEKNKFMKVLFTSIVGRKFPSDQAEPVKATETILAETAQWMQLRTDSLKYVNEVLFDLKADSTVTSRFVSLEKYLSNPFALTEGEDAFLNVKLKRDIQEMGGLGRLFTELIVNVENYLDISWYQKQLEELLAADYFEKGKTLGGREYQLTADDRKKIQQFFGKFQELNQFSLVIGYNQHLLPKLVKTEQGSANLVLKSGLHSLYQQDIAKAAAAWMMTPEQTQMIPYRGQEIAVPSYLLTGKDRLLAKTLVEEKHMGANAKLGQSFLRTALEAPVVKTLSQILGREVPSGLSPNELTKLVEEAGLAKDLNAEVLEWLEGELELLKLLSPEDSGLLADKI